jgi:hypothetical protein
MAIVGMEPGLLDKEIERRERLVEIFLIIGGFFAASSSFCENASSSTLLFLQFIVAMLLYYVFLSRTTLRMFINWLAFFASLSYALILVRFINMFLDTALEGLVFALSLAAFTAIFTFALAYPGTSEILTNKVTASIEKRSAENPAFIKTTSMVLFIILTALVIIELFLIYR